MSDSGSEERGLESRRGHKFQLRIKNEKLRIRIAVVFYELLIILLRNKPIDLLNQVTIMGKSIWSNEECRFFGIINMI